MFRAIGTILVIYALSQMLSGAFNAFERTTVAVLGTVETAANLSSIELTKAAQNK